MKNLYQLERVEEVKRRLNHLYPDSPRQWGTMTAPQAVAHCSGGLEMALGELPPERLFLGRIIGRIIKPLVFGDDAPMRRNSPTIKALIVLQDELDLDFERVRLVGLIDRFATAGTSGCTTLPHSFFGKLTPEQWAILMYKHLDHHLRQFGT